ncbi:MAG TPA: ABC transporter permease [Actinomycetota bacterium]|jgi:spermidine/putrescine transport system permease protein|nr:ABC transporter permease [Actinomycetota bacterium]
MAQRVADSERGARRIRAPRFAMALPAWIWFVFFFTLPVLWIVYYSFGYKPDIFHPIATDKLSFDTYHEAFSSTFLHVFSQTLQISILGTALCFLIGFPFAYWLATRVAPRWRGLLLGLVVVPFFVNFLVRTIGWFILLSPNGPVSSLLQRSGIRSEPLHLLETRGAVQLGVVYNYLALMILPLFVTLDRLDPAMREASKDLGASRWKTFRQVTLPLSAPGIVAGLLLVFIPLTGDYITALVLGGAKGNMAGVMVASQFTIAQNWALGAAQAVILIAMIMGTVAVFAVIALAIRTIARANRKITLPPIVEETA